MIIFEVFEMTKKYKGIDKKFISNFVKRELGEKISDSKKEEHIILYPCRKFLDEIGYKGDVTTGKNNYRSIEEQLNIVGPANWFFKVNAIDDGLTYSIKMIKKDVWYLKNNN